MTHFQRSYSRVWWANDDNIINSSSQVTESQLPYQIYYYGPQSLGQLSNIAEETSYRALNIRRSIRSHDSGFNDSDHSPNSTSSSSQISAHNQDNELDNDENENYLSPNRNVSGSLDRSPSLANETIKTPPTVIRRKICSIFTPTARRISFSAPSTPDQLEPPKLNSSFRSLDSFSTRKSKEQNIQNEQQLNSSLNSSLNRSRAKNCSLRRGKTISPCNNSSYRRRANRRRLLDCVSQVSGSTSDVYTLASTDSSYEKEIKKQPEEYHHYETVSEVKSRSSSNTSRANSERENSTVEYNNETVTFGTGDDEVTPTKKDESIQVQQREKLPLPTYDELYPPNGCSTPMLKPKKNVSYVAADHTESSITTINGSSQFEPREQFQENDGRDNCFHSDFNLSLAPTMNWEGCTYIEYTNPALNGHACSTQFWLDEQRTMYYHEIMSTLQTKSILYEAARSLKLNPPIAAKLIHQIQLKGIAIETKFDEIDRIFEAHAKLLKRLRRRSSTTLTNGADDESIEIADNEFKEKISILMKSLTENVCHFMSRLNSKIIFQKVDWCMEYDGGKDLKHFERNVRTLIDLCQDLRVACETKIDDIETNVLLKDFYTLKQSVLTAIRKVFRRLMNIIVSRVEENPNEMLLRANINVIATLPMESVYNSSERFSSLNDAFIASGVIRVLLMICLDADKISIRAMALRALTTICSSSEMIRQFIEYGGLDVVTDILTDDKRNNVKFEPELREAVSVLTQVTAPWHYGDSGNIDDLLKLSIDNLVTRLTVLIESTDCLQTLMLAAACLNNLSRKSSLAFYSLMDNRSVHQLIQACDRYQRHRFDFMSSAIFLYEQITSMLFNMAGNKKCHQHLAHKEIVYFISFIFQTQFHMKYLHAAEKTALRKTIKNILHIFARLIHHSAIEQEILEQNVIPIFLRVEQNLQVDDAYAKDLQYINKKLNKSFDVSNSQNSFKTKKQKRLSVCNMSGSSLLESYV